MGKEKESLEQRNERQRLLMAQRNAIARDLKLPRIASPKRRALCLADPARFMKTYFPRIFYNPWTSYHKVMIDAVAESVQYGTRKGIAAPRGDGKTMIGIAMEIWAMCSGYHDFAVILGATGDKASEILSNTKAMLTTDEFVADFPEIGFPLKALGGESRKAGTQTVNGKPTRVNWSSDRIVLPNIDGSPCPNGVFIPLSMDGTIRGINHEGRRPKHGIVDDPETRQSAENEEIVKHRMKIIEEDFAGLKGPDNIFGITAFVTIMNPFCLAAKITDPTQKPAWSGMRFGLIKEWPKNRRLWDEYIALRKTCQESGDSFAWEATLFYIRHRQAMDEGCVMNNPYRYNPTKSPQDNPIEISAIQSCMNMIADAESIDSFLCEYQNDTKVFGVETDMREKVITAKVVEKRTNGFEKGNVSEETIGITSAIDVGRRFCHWVDIGWMPENRGMVFDYGVVEVHHYQASSVNLSLKAALKDWHEAKAASPTAPNWIMIDTSDGTLSDTLYEFILESPDFPPIAASKGYGKGQGPKPIEFVPEAERSNMILGSHWYAKLQPTKGIWLYHPDANHWKKWVQDRFHFDSFDDQGNQMPDTLTLYRPHHIRQHMAYAQHIVSEIWDEKKRQFKAGTINNHWLDATYMACVGAAINNWITTLEPKILV